MIFKHFPHTIVEGKQMTVLANLQTQKSKYSNVNEMSKKTIDIAKYSVNTYLTESIESIKKITTENQLEQLQQTNIILNDHVNKLLKALEIYGDPNLKTVSKNDKQKIKTLIEDEKAFIETQINAASQQIQQIELNIKQELVAEIQDVYNTIKQQQKDLGTAPVSLDTNTQNAITKTLANVEMQLAAIKNIDDTSEDIEDKAEIIIKLKEINIIKISLNSLLKSFKTSLKSVAATHQQLDKNYTDALESVNQLIPHNLNKVSIEALQQSSEKAFEVVTNDLPTVDNLSDYHAQLKKLKQERQKMLSELTETLSNAEISLESNNTAIKKAAHDLLIIANPTDDEEIKKINNDNNRDILRLESSLNQAEYEMQRALEPIISQQKAEPVSTIEPQKQSKPKGYGQITLEEVISEVSISRPPSVTANKKQRSITANKKQRSVRQKHLDIEIHDAKKEAPEATQPQTTLRDLLIRLTTYQIDLVHAQKVSQKMHELIDDLDYVERSHFYATDVGQDIKLKKLATYHELSQQIDQQIADITQFSANTYSSDIVKNKIEADLTEKATTLVNKIDKMPVKPDQARATIASYLKVKTSQDVTPTIGENHEAFAKAYDKVKRNGILSNMIDAGLIVAATAAATITVATVLTAAPMFIPIAGFAAFATCIGALVVKNEIQLNKAEKAATAANAKFSSKFFAKQHQPADDTQNLVLNGSLVQ